MGGAVSTESTLAGRPAPPRTDPAASAAAGPRPAGGPTAGGDGAGADGVVAARERRSKRRASLIGTAIGFVPFVMTLWDWRLDPLRAARSDHFGSGFYEIQARALLDGNLAVPRGSLSIEGFVIDGRTYMYFPPFPALLRVPVVALTERLDGRLTALSMLLAWLVLAAATSWLAWSAWALVRPDSRVGRWDQVAIAIFVASCTGGSMIVFDAALPWVYHEVYVWATAWAVVTLAGLLALARQPDRRTAAVTIAGALGAMLTRVTAGWAMSLTVVAFGIFLATASRRRRLGLVLVGGGLGCLLVGVTINWAKFRHPYMFPLEHQVWTQVNFRRRLALLVNGGTITGPQFFGSSAVAYLRPDGIRFVPYFPFVTLPAGPPGSVGGAFLDQTYRTGSVPAFTPLLAVTAIWGWVTTLTVRPWRRAGALLIPLAGATAVTGGVMFYGYLAYRYTSEFLPMLVVAGAVGVADVTRRLHRGAARPTWALAAAAMMIVLALFGAYANAAAGFGVARTTWKGERLAEYVSLQAAVGDVFGQGAGTLVRQSAALPAAGRTDELRIVGNCEALYVGTGDQYEPWAMVEGVDRTVVIDVDAGGTSAGVARLFAVEGLATRNVTLETSDDDRIRLRIGEGLLYLPTPWLDVAPGERIEVSLVPEPSRDRYRLTVGDTMAEYLPMVETDSQGFKTVATAAFDLPPASAQERLGVALTTRLGEPLALCHRLLAAAAG